MSYASKSPDERRILDLMNLLKFHPNKCAALASFETWFFDTRPRLTPDFIRLLLQGKSGAESEGGIMHTIGDISYSHVAARAALYLLCRLLDVEKNKDAHLFLDQFTSFDVHTLKKLNLSAHILSERGNRIGAFKLVQILANAARPDLQLEAVVSDAAALREYHKWAARRNEGSGQIVPFNHSGTANKEGVYQKSLNLPLVPPAAKDQQQAAAEPHADLAHIRQLRARISEILHDMKRVVEEKDIPIWSGGDAPPPASLQRDGGSAWRVVAPPPMFDANNQSLPAPLDSFDDDVSILYRTRGEVVSVKVECIMPYSMEQVAPYLADVSKQATRSTE